MARSVVVMAPMLSALPAPGPTGGGRIGSPGQHRVTDGDATHDDEPADESHLGAPPAGLQAPHGHRRARAAADRGTEGPVRPTPRAAQAARRALPRDRGLPVPHRHPAGTANRAG